MQAALSVPETAPRTAQRKYVPPKAGRWRDKAAAAQSARYSNAVQQRERIAAEFSALLAPYSVWWLRTSKREWRLSIKLGEQVVLTYTGAAPGRVLDTPDAVRRIQTDLARRGILDAPRD